MHDSIYALPVALAYLLVVTVVVTALALLQVFAEHMGGNSMIARKRYEAIFYFGSIIAIVPLVCLLILDCVEPGIIEFLMDWLVGLLSTDLVSW